MSRVFTLAIALQLTAILAVCLITSAQAKFGHKKAHHNQSVRPQSQEFDLARAVTCVGWRDQGQKLVLEKALKDSWPHMTGKSYALVVVRVTPAAAADQSPTFTVNQPSGHADTDESALQACRSVLSSQPQLITASLPANQRDAFIAFAYQPGGQPAQIVSLAQVDALCAFETIQAPNGRGREVMEPVHDWSARICRVAAITVNKTMQTQGGASILLPLDITYLVEVEAAAGRPMKIKVVKQSGNEFFDRWAAEGIKSIEQDPALPVAA